MIEAGREALAEELRREGLPVQRMWASEQLKKVISDFSYVDLDALLAAIGEHHVSARGIAQRVARGFRGGDDDEQLPATVLRPRRKRTEADKVGVHVEGLDDVMVRLSRCCTPVPGDEIMGFVTRGRGVSVHRTDCANAASLSVQAQRVIDVDWDSDHDSTFVVSVEVEALDRSWLLRDLAHVLADHHVNILGCTTQTSNDRIARFHFDFELADPSHLESVLRAIQRVDSVYEAYRSLPGAARRTS